MKLLNPATRKFISYAKPYRWLVVWATICGLLKFNIPVLFPWILKDIIDYLLKTASPAVRRINQTMIFLIGIYCIYMLATYYRSYFADNTNQRLTFDLRRELYAHLQRMSLNFYEKHRVGSIASRLINDISIAQIYVGAVFTNTIMDVSVILFITLLLFHMNVKLAIVSLIIFPFYVLLNNYFKKRILTTSRLAQLKLEEITGNVTERLGGISIIQSFTREKVEERHFFQDMRVYLGHRIANIKHNALAASVIGFLTSIAPVFVIWYGSIQVIRHNLTVGELTAFYAYLAMFYQPLNRLTELNILLANSQSAIERIYEVFETASDIVDDADAQDIKSIRGEIEFRDVTFEYELHKPVLKNIQLHIPTGSVNAIVGPSGSGKSTFIKLIPHFYEIKEGSITIDGIDIHKFTLKSLRKLIALVPQEPILFSGTIYENILMGKQDALDEEVRRASQSANAHDFIMEFPAGYQTVIGEGGVGLSGGQRQRIAIARAFLKNAPILLLDEATSSLDSESESLVKKALQRLIKNRTTIIIAHRLSTIQSADNIIVLKGGK
ncbi:MAG: ABC transporter ATP-binding protein, partial [bacterium]